MIIRPQVQETHALLRSLLAGGMPKDKYLKGVLSLAYEYAVAGELADCRTLVKECDELYLLDVLPLQMADDPVFHEVALMVAKKLAESGVGESAIRMTSNEVGRA